MSHGHSHADMMHEQTHAQKSRHEYRNYCYLFAVSIASAGAEFLIALLLAHSVSAQADAIHALTHLSLYALALWVSRQVLIRRMDAHAAHHYREKFLIFYALFVFIGLAWIFYTALAKISSSEPVVSNYMLISGIVGLCGNIVALRLLRTISKIHGEAVHARADHQWISLDTWGDFALSILVVYNAMTALLSIRLLDVIASFGAVVWIGVSGLRILKKKTFNHSH